MDDVLVDGVVAEAGPVLARALAPLRPHGERAGDSSLPDRVRYLDLAGLGAHSGPPDADAVRRRWDESPAGRSTTALLGVGPDGPIRVDLRRDGPHALVAGTSGSGHRGQRLLAHLELPVLHPDHDVDPGELRVRLRVIVPGVAAPALLALERGERDRARDREEVCRSRARCQPGL